MKSKRITVNDKLLDKIHRIIYDESNIGNVPEMQNLYSLDGSDVIFSERPERWTELENCLFEMTERIAYNIEEKIKEVLK